MKAEQIKQIAAAIATMAELADQLKMVSKLELQLSVRAFRDIGNLAEIARSAGVQQIMDYLSTKD